MMTIFVTSRKWSYEKEKQCAIKGFYILNKQL